MYRQYAEKFNCNVCMYVYEIYQNYIRFDSIIHRIVVRKSRASNIIVDSKSIESKNLTR